MNIVIILAGFLTLVAGYQLCPMYVAAVGIILGEQLLTHFQLTSGTWDTLTFALLCGVLGYLVAHYFRKISTYLAVFLTGGYLVSFLLPDLGWLNLPFSWLIFILGGGIALVLSLVYFSFGVILVSSLGGAAVLSSRLTIPGLDPQISFIILWIFGMATQFILLNYVQTPQ